MKGPAARQVLSFIFIFFKKIVGRAFEYVAQRLQIIELYTRRFVVYDLVEILIAQPELDIEPIFRFALFFQYFRDSEFHRPTSGYLMYTLYNKIKKCLTNRCTHYIMFALDTQNGGSLPFGVSEIFIKGGTR